MTLVPHGVIPQLDLDALFDCGKGLGYEVYFYQVRDVSVPYVKKTPDSDWVYWNPLDPKRMDHFDLLLNVNLKIEIFTTDDGPTDVIIRAYNETRRGHVGGTSRAERQLPLTPEQFCRKLVEATTQYFRYRNRIRIKAERHLMHEQRRIANAEA